MTDIELDSFKEDFEEDIKRAEEQTKPKNTEQANGDNETVGNTTGNKLGQEVAEASADQAAHEPGDSEGGSYKQELGLFSGISNFDYHRGPGISSTQLKHQLKAPRLYQAYATGELVFEQTKAMRIGSAVHALTLEPDDFYNQVAIIPPEGKGASKAAKEFMAKFNRTHHGKVILKLDEFTTVQHMRDSLMTHPEAGEILSDDDGVPEMSGYYKDYDPETEIGTHMLCKFRPDKRFDWCMADVKSTTDASKAGFQHSVGKFGYAESGVHYLEGDRILAATDHNQFFFLCVESSPPYLVAVYWLDAAALKYGHWRRRKALHSIRQCRINKEWPHYNNNEVTSISVPGYLTYEMEND